jgi:MFS transporter, UMF1 family
MTFKKNNPKVLTAWTMYDWANSVHSLTITSAVFPIYYASTAVNAQGGEMIDFLGFSIKNSVLYSYTVSIAFLMLVFTTPLFSGIADYTGRKKLFMRIYCYLGAFSCMSMFFFDKNHINTGIFSFLFSVVGWGGSIVFYNSFLPEIATEDRFDNLSARGFTMGYIGSVLLLIQNLTMLQKPEWYGGIDTGAACRFSFLLVGLWWFSFAHITFHYLPKTMPKPISRGEAGQFILSGLGELKKSFLQLTNYPTLKKYLLAFFFYNMGAMTVIYMGTMFGVEVLKLPSSALIITILLIQLVAIPGAYLFSNLSAKIGNVQSLMGIVIIWIGCVTYAYFVQTTMQFYMLASGIGFVMGGVQSLSRSTYSKLIPDNTHDTASFFSFYDVCDRLSTVIGTFLFGLVNQLTGSMRNSILFLALLFLLGLWLLSNIRNKPLQA